MSGRGGGLAAVIGPSLFVLVFLVEGWLRPGYNPAADYVSALSLGERGWVQIASFLIVGGSVLLFTAAVAREFPQGAASRAGPILLGSVGAGLLLSGPFVMDPAGTPSPAMSWHGLIHGVLGGIVFLLMPIVCFVYLKRFGLAPRWRALWMPTLVLGTITAVADLVFTVATKVPNLVILTAPWGESCNDWSSSRSWRGSSSSLAVCFGVPTELSPQATSATGHARRHIRMSGRPKCVHHGDKTAEGLVRAMGSCQPVRAP